jgi:hypothetical protein
MAALSQHPAIGPNALRHMEQPLAAIADLGLDHRRARSLLLAVDVYTTGSGTMALAERQVRQRDQLTEAQWRASADAYLQHLTQPRNGRTLRNWSTPGSCTTPQTTMPSTTDSPGYWPASPPRSNKLTGRPGRGAGVLRDI